MQLQVRIMDFRSELLKTRFFNRSKTHAPHSAGVFGLPVEKAKEFLMAVVGIKKRANYLFRMFTPLDRCVGKYNEKEKKTCFGVSPLLGGVSKNTKKLQNFFTE